MKKGFRVEIACMGEGKTEDAAIDCLLFNMNETMRNIDHADGADFLVIQECELKE